MGRLFLTAAAMALSACTPPDSAYPRQYEYNFIQACQARQPAAGYCACIWERIEAEVPRADFEAVERSPADQRATHPVTLQVEGFAIACAAAQEQE